MIMIRLFFMKKIFSVAVMLFVANAAWAQLYISPAATLHLSDNAHITLYNLDLVNNGAINTPTNSRLVFNGSNNNSISGTAVPTLSELEIAKTGNGLLTLQTDISVMNKIIFTSNIIDLNNHNIELGITGFLEGESESSRITGTTGGEVQCTATLDAPSGINPGNLGAVITSSQDLGVTTIHRGHTTQTNSSDNGTSIYRYYDIAPTNNSGLNATLRINYFDAEKNSLNEDDFELFKKIDGMHWIDMSHSNRSAALNFVEQSHLDDFSRFTISSEAGALPVTGLVLTGQWKNNAVFLDWKTQTERNNSHFDIERKYKNDINFMVIGSRKSAHKDSESQSPTHYNWIDHYANGSKGPVLYRIRQQSLDDAYSYSNTIAIRPDQDLHFIKNIYPTLFAKDQLYLQAGNISVTEMQVQVFDMKGSLVLSKRLRYESQWLSLPNIAGGSYRISIRSGSHQWQGSFFKK